MATWARRVINKQFERINLEFVFVVLSRTVVYFTVCGYRTRKLNNFSNDCLFFFIFTYFRNSYHDCIYLEVGKIWENVEWEKSFIFPLKIHNKIEAKPSCQGSKSIRPRTSQWTNNKLLYNLFFKLYITLLKGQFERSTTAT
jgi:hypothetical protein